ncbi:hypothetical protein DFH06DRAFT_1227315 [Mycena polygramma]|nr:hypothetical protein DFH06DRAFT_1227315 [Mycena polygramma]
MSLHNMQPTSPASPPWPHHRATWLAAARSAIPPFRTAEWSARDLISTLWSVVEALKAGASIVSTLVDILDKGEYREAVLAAWCTFGSSDAGSSPSL